MAHIVRRANQHRQPLCSAVTQQAVWYITSVESPDARGQLAVGSLICMVTGRRASLATFAPVSPVRLHPTVRLLHAI